MRCKSPRPLWAISGHNLFDYFVGAGTHPLLGDEMRALRALKRDAESPFIFVSERGAPFSVSGLQKLVERAGIAAKMPFKVHPHMLRHATGYAVANRATDTRTLQAYLGHRSRARSDTPN